MDFDLAEVRAAEACWGVYGGLFVMMWGLGWWWRLGKGDCGFTPVAVVSNIRLDSRGR